MKKLITVFIVLICMLTACSTSEISHFLKEVDAGNYIDAKEYYDEKIYGNSEKEIAAYSELEKRLSNVYNDYNEGKIDYNKAQSIVSTLEKVGVLDSFQISVVYENLYQLQISKTNFESAQELFEQSYYEDALFLYCSVSYADSNYSEALNKIDEIKEIITNETLSEVTDLENNNCFTDAMTLINNTIGLIGQNTELQSKYNQLSAKYLEYSIDEAENIFNNNKNYDGAISLITATIDILGEDPRLIAELEKYQAYIPVYINELDYIDRYGELIKKSQPKDNYGNIYKYGLRVGGWGNDTYYVTYYLGQNYSTFSGTCILPYSYRNTSESKCFEIYGDSKLLFKSNSMTSMSMPQDFNINVEDVTNLTIKFSMPDSLSVVLLCDGLLEK